MLIHCAEQFSQRSWRLRQKRPPSVVWGWCHTVMYATGSLYTTICTNIMILVLFFKCYVLLHHYKFYLVFFEKSIKNENFKISRKIEKQSEFWNIHVLLTFTKSFWFFCLDVLFSLDFFKKFLILQKNGMDFSLYQSKNFPGKKNHT